MRYYPRLLFIVFTVFCSCTDLPPQPVNGTTMGWAPVYASDSSVLDIRVDTPHAFTRPGKIMVGGHFIYQLESDSGIHVIDISNPASPRQAAFIKIAGVDEFTVGANYLYVNNLGDLVVVDVSDPPHAREVYRISNGFNPAYGQYPPASGYFECPDPVKGRVIGWVFKELTNPKCYR